MRIHITAVAGTGMGALAGLLQEMGHEVTGSDVAFYPPMGPALEQWGIHLFTGFDKQHLRETAEHDAPDLVVIGNVCRKDNAEAVAAVEFGVPRLHIADALRRFALPGTAPLVVAGTHGKTTTSSLCAHLLDRCGLAPGFLIGGVPSSLGRSFRAAGKRKLQSSGSFVGTRRPPFVLEGDEYDTAFWEKTAKFLHYDAEIAIITSIEHDHIDIYPTFDSYRSSFVEFVRGLPKNGLLIACASEQAVVEVAQTAACEVAYYALEGEDTHGVAPHWLAAPAQETETGITFDLFAGGVMAGRYVSPLAGRHNLKNAVAALAAAAQGYGVPLRSLAEPLAEFRGVKRRQELRGTVRGVRVYDDFAHHPTAVDATLDALRKKHRQGKLIAIFEPRSATACRRLHQDAYARAFAAADVILLAPVGRTELAAEEKLDVAELARALGVLGKNAEAPGDVDAIVARTAATAEAGDTVLVLSNGAFGGIFDKLLAALAG